NHFRSEIHKITNKIFMITITGNIKIKKIGSTNLAGLITDPEIAKRIRTTKIKLVAINMRFVIDFICINTKKFVITTQQ
ncbi:MAG: hypothetical protein WBI06_14630, partial [Paludibacter sp.]